MAARRAAAVAVLLALTLPLAVITGSPPSKPKEIDPSAFRPVVVPSDPPLVESVDRYTRGERRHPLRTALSPVPSATDTHDPSPSSRIAAPLPAVRSTDAARPPKATTRRVSGTPTYYCWAGHSRCTRGHPDVAGAQLYAAAGPSLRVGKWRGRVVTVSANGRSVRVTLVDWCACGGSHFIDLYHDAWVRLGSPSRATVSW